jgi:hypothetical protein
MEDSSKDRDFALPINPMSLATHMYVAVLRCVMYSW